MSAIASEIERFNRLSATWWDARGPMRPLHVTNELRLGYTDGLIREHFPTTADAPLDGLRVLDVGCGAGLMCELLAKLGDHVTRLDAAEKNMAAGRILAADSAVEIDYRSGTPESALGCDERYHVVLLLEVVEHVESVPDFVATAAKHLRPAGCWSPPPSTEPRRASCSPSWAPNTCSGCCLEERIPGNNSWDPRSWKLLPKMQFFEHSAPGACATCR